MADPDRSRLKVKATKKRDDMRCPCRYLHKANPKIIHRDLKPENIMLTLESDKVVAKLGDFGLHAVLKKPKRTYSQTESDDIVLNEIPSSTESRTRVSAVLRLWDIWRTVCFRNTERLQSKHRMFSLEKQDPSCIWRRRFSSVSLTTKKLTCFPSH